MKRNSFANDQESFRSTLARVRIKLRGLSSDGSPDNGVQSRGVVGPVLVSHLASGFAPLKTSYQTYTSENH
jgi:hypothetical protein